MPAGRQGRVASSNRGYHSGFVFFGKYEKNLIKNFFLFSIKTGKNHT
jgi:hypothetical protein